MSKLPLVAVDWDNTCVEPRYPAMGEWKPGCITYLTRLTKSCQVVIFTARMNKTEVGGGPRKTMARGQDYDRIRRMLDDAGFHEIDIWVGEDAKPPAVCYVDDRSIEFHDNWRQVYRKVMKAVEKAKYYSEYVVEESDGL